MTRDGGIAKMETYVLNAIITTLDSPQTRLLPIPPAPPVRPDAAGNAAPFSAQPDTQDPAPSGPPTSEPDTSGQGTSGQDPTDPQSAQTGTPRSDRVVGAASNAGPDKAQNFAPNTEPALRANQSTRQQESQAMTENEARAAAIAAVEERRSDAVLQTIIDTKARAERKPPESVTVVGVALDPAIDTSPQAAAKQQGKQVDLRV